jgi:hypothetical protein
MTQHYHDNLRWPDGRRIVTWRVFPNLRENPKFPDWQWSVADFDLGDPCEGYYPTQQAALLAAADAIEEQQEPEQQQSCPDRANHSDLGCRTCGLPSTAVE